MDWTSVTFDWNHARAFLATAEEGSLSAAARALGVAQPTLGRQVSALEKTLGVALFERAGRGLVLTPNGLELVDHVRAMSEAANRVSLAASGQSQSIDGSVCISASEAFCYYLLGPLVPQLRAAEPGIHVEIIATNELSDLRRREADIAVRNVRPEDPDLIGRKIGDSKAGLYAAHSYLAEHGPFPTFATLNKADFVGFDVNEEFVKILNSQGFGLTDANFTTRSNSHVVHWDMVKRGLGIGVMASIIADQEPLVAPAARWLEPFSFPTWLVAHREVKTSRRVRLVYDWLAEELTALLRAG